VLIVVALQLWLLTATMNACLGGEDSIIWPGGIVSAAGLTLNVGLPALPAPDGADRQRRRLSDGACWRGRRQETSRCLRSMPVRSSRNIPPFDALALSRAAGRERFFAHALEISPEVDVDR
jgi:hypothetical protein